MIKFGTGGWRAIIGDEFTKENVQILAMALAHKIKLDGVQGKGFVIGYDRRFLSKEAAGWAAEALAGAGIHTDIIKRDSPTPLVMYAVAKQDYAFGMAVTASHNPAIYNGVKVFMPGGRDADEFFTSELEEHIETVMANPTPVVELAEALAAGSVCYTDPMNEYIDNIIEAVDMQAIRDANLHIALDPMYGVSQTALQTILLTSRCAVEVIHERHDTLFGGRLPAPTEKTLAALTNFVAEHECDMGIATDGDADRLGVIDDKAQFVHPNKILVLLYYYLLKYKGWKGSAVRNIATTHMLDRVAADFGESCFEVPVGFKYISSKMLETGAIIGGESSGGLTVRGHIQGKDGIYAGSLLVEMIAKTGRSLSELWNDIEEAYGKCEMAERDYHFTMAKRTEMYTMLLEDKLLPSFDLPVKKVSYQDGCKVYFENGGWIIARFSGTEPLLRIFCEMPNMELADQIADVMEKFLDL